MSRSLEASQANGLPPYSTQEVFTWEAGYDCGKEGANTLNCHFSHFSSERKMKVWEEGKRAAMAGEPKPEFKP